MEIPESLSVIAGGDINRQNIKALKDIGFKVPNLNLAMRLDGFPNVSIRGLGAFGNTQGVGFYLDDVQLFSDASSRFGDLARIEVLKGPQGVLYGGSNIGGAVKFVSARPDPEEAFGRVKVLGGQQGMIDAEASVNAPLGDTGWAMRLFGFGSSHDGFIKNRKRRAAQRPSRQQQEELGRNRGLRRARHDRRAAGRAVFDAGYRTLERVRRPQQYLESGIGHGSVPLSDYRQYRADQPTP